ncbi:hypothetical protein CEXT_305931 [Caerostris extrusa]|uniref:Uncharacterized protein n=1 Tax=Caerostris extrusa TaxID=172846 RepID=A0AAV4VIU7_CAEEX|nr:hypothetical protein CEXT_305931 [Caerostris extrusa]
MSTAFTVSASGILGHRLNTKAGMQHLPIYFSLTIIPAPNKAYGGRRFNPKCFVYRLMSSLAAVFISDDDQL